MKVVHKNKLKPKSGILSDLSKLKRLRTDFDHSLIEDKCGQIILWSDVEAIINKYNP